MDICPKADSSPPPPPHTQTSRGWELSWTGCGGVTGRQSTAVSNSHLPLVISGLTSILLAVLGTLNLHFQGALVPISLQSILGIVAAHVLGIVLVII